MINIMLADDHKIFREGLISIIEKEQDLKIIGESEDGRETVEKAKELKPDVIIMDISMPNLNGIEASYEIKKNLPGIKIIGLSMHSDKRFVKRMLEAGASGFLLKSCASKELVLAIRTVYSRKSFFSEKVMETIIEDYSSGMGGIKAILEDKKLTHREYETLQLMAEGKSLKEIASELSLSIKSIEVYKKQIMEKLNLHNIVDIIKYAIREGIISIE